MEQRISYVHRCKCISRPFKQNIKENADLPSAKPTSQIEVNYKKFASILFARCSSCRHVEISITFRSLTQIVHLQSVCIVAKLAKWRQLKEVKRKERKKMVHSSESSLVYWLSLKYKKLRNSRRLNRVYNSDSLWQFDWINQFKTECAIFARKGKFFSKKSARNFSVLRMQGDVRNRKNNVT